MFFWYNVFVENWLKNKKIIITGASSGIGKALAEELIFNYNCAILGVARNEEKLQEFKNSLKEKANSFEYISVDVSKKDSWVKILEVAKQKEYTILVNNAGTMLPFKSAEKITYEEAERIFNVNFFSCVNAFKAFKDYFSSKGNCAIINISSLSAVCSIPGQSMYSASKSALTSFSKIITAENKNKIFIATYLPGFTKTNLFNNKDNETSIFDKKALKLINKIGDSPQNVAKKIARCIKNKRKYKIFGFDSFLLKKLSKIMPIKSSEMMLKIFKLVNFECFKDI